MNQIHSYGLKSFTAICLLLVSPLAISAPPTASGVVTIAGIPTAWIWADTDRGYLVIVGSDVTELCPGPDIENWDIVPYHLVSVPNTDARIIANGAGYVQATVFDFIDGDCDVFLTATPVAIGMVDYHATSTDFATGFDGDNAYTQAVQIKGTVYDYLTGAPLRIQGNFGYVWNAQVFKETLATIKLR